MWNRACLVVGLAAASLIPSCSSEGDHPGGALPEGAVGRLDEHRSFAAPVAVANLKVWPIVTDAPLDVGDFSTLQEAQAAGTAAVRERSDGAQVNSLEIENSGDRPILVCAGTLVKGGQQDRQIGQDFVVAARSTVPVDAYCVEPHRWAGASLGFAACDFLAIKSVRASAQYDGDQAGVWEEVVEANDVACCPSPSGSLFAAVESAAPDAKQRREELERTVHARFDQLLARDDAVVGFAYAVNGEPVTIRSFANRELFERQLGPFVKAMALEAELAGRRAGDASARDATIEDVLALVHASEAEPEEVVPTSGGNENRYRKGRRAASSRCLLGSLGFVLTEDWTAR